MEKIKAIIAENIVMAGLLAAGLLLIGVGGAKMMRESQGETLEIVEPASELPQNQMKPTTVVIDVQGAVASPSVYRLDNGARVAEALAAAGGLSGEADSEWVAKMMNQAEVVRDGMKLYIPFRNEGNNEKEIMSNDNGIIAGTNTINVNTASEMELDALWGIGPVRAKAIIDNRPYNSIEELKTKANIPQDVIDKNEGKITIN